jgi:hypothetical protein
MLRNLLHISLGDRCVLPTWFYSPYKALKTDQLFICDQCCSYFPEQAGLVHHREHDCVRTPGREIYRSDDLSIFQLSGVRQKFAAQCLCLLGKLFVPNMLHFNAVESFDFYALFECDDQGAHICGFFSKNLEEPESVLCDLVILPPYHKRSFAFLMISLSYEMAHRLRTPGGPSGPLNPGEANVFRRFWRIAISAAVRDGLVDPDDIALRTGIRFLDVLACLAELGCLTCGSEGPRANPAELGPPGPLPACHLNPRMLLWVPLSPGAE